jgi:hypothetical protein
MRIVRIAGLALALGAAVSSSRASAAGVDSHAYRCGDLQRLIAAQRFVFINNPSFEDFVVADIYYCGGGAPQIQLRSVPTIDQPECLVNYCVPTPSRGGN